MADNADNSGISGYADPETKLRKDGQPDRRFKEHGGGSHGNQGTSYEEIGDGSSSLVTDPAQATGEDTAQPKPSLRDGKKLDGTPDARTSSEHGFGGDKGLASQAGTKGGESSYENGRLTT